VLEPIEAKLEFKVFSRAETIVKIATKAVIPIAIIMMVSTVRKICVRIEPKAILIFSLNTLVIISTSFLLFLVIFDCKI
jgi:hypothetical protein